MSGVRDPTKGTQAGNALVGRATERATIDALLAAAERAQSGSTMALDATLGGTEHDALDPFRIGLAVLNLVAEAASAEPILIVIDDAHWLDDESAVALSFVARRLHAERLAMLVTIRETRDTGIRFENLHRLYLAGLSGAATARTSRTAHCRPRGPAV